MILKDIRGRIFFKVITFNISSVILDMEQLDKIEMIDSPEK